MVANPKTVVADPSAVVADPKAVVTDPRAAVADSRAVADPKSSAANPKSSAANLRSSVADPRAAVATVARRYLKFAEANPALYDAMFNLHTDLPFGRADTPAPLRAAFAAIQDVLAPVAGGRDSAVLAELTWSALHGIATLSRDGRLPPEYATERIDALVDLVTGQ
ncbi:MAG TPA: TetR-like C-terminal domain-containing protein [Pseudonocardiaceae bacterium]